MHQPTSSVLVVDATPSRKPSSFAASESCRDFAGVAIGVAIGLLFWLAALSLVRMTP
jgi:hypothetical protein